GVGNDENQETGSFDVLAYPNPFNGVCSLNLLSYQVNENVVIRVYDATGKLVEAHNLLPGDVKKLEIGADYAKGLYNIIVGQGSQTKSIKVIRQ
ncbi:UNVERIFIED_CONTAM: T9SS type A sorting domain-containing protein, partial [Salmonella enterica subsp. enterica serovar Weltevreden]